MCSNKTLIYFLSAFRLRLSIPPWKEIDLLSEAVVADRRLAWLPLAVIHCGSVVLALFQQGAYQICRSCDSYVAPHS